MKLSDLHTKITDLQLRIDDLRKSTRDPNDALADAIKELFNALEEMDIAQKEQCQHYLRLFNFAPEGCVVTDLKGTIKEANIAASDLLQSEIKGIPLAAFLEEENLDDLKNNLDCLNRGEVIHDWVVRMRPPEGMPVLVSISASVILDIQEKPSCLSWLLHDMTGYRKVGEAIKASEENITKSKRTEEALQESEEKYRLLINTANESIIVAQDGLLKFVNPLTPVLLGVYSEQELIDRPFYEFIHPDDRNMVVENYRRRISGEAVLPRYAFRVVTRDDCVKWVEINATLIEWQGKPATLNFLTDITERKLAEEALLFKHIILSTQQEASIDGILVVDENGEILSYNQRFVDMWGIPPDVIESKCDERALQSVMDKLASPEDFICGVKRIYEAKDEISTDEVVLKDGRSFDRYSAPMFGAGGKYYGRVWYFRDITDRKLAEEARERLLRELEIKNIEMDRFIYTVSHDLRSPLVTINGFVRFLESDLAKGNSDLVKVDLKIIRSTISKMDNFLKDTLELARIGRIANPPEVVPFAEIVQEALDLISEKICEKGVRVTINPNLPLVNVDRMRIVEVLTNLMENSIKYIGGQPHPNIEVGCRLDGDKEVFFVKDNGMGIDPSLHDKVFELFYRVDKTSEGSGAGLAIVKRIIEVHGGRIWIESERGKGCTVCFNLSVAK